MILLCLSVLMVCGRGASAIGQANSTGEGSPVYARRQAFSRKLAEIKAGQCVEVSYAHIHRR